MSIGPIPGLIGSVAGAPLAQVNGTEAQRAHQEVASQQRQVESVARSETAAGIGAADGEDKEVSDRDADGRRLWELPPPSAEEGGTPLDDERHSRDASGECGQELDLCG